jgi:cytoplasmic tRNA 2-thiolation protein 2
MEGVACMKCKAAPAITTIRQKEPYCQSCIDTGVQQKCRVETKASGLISTGDRALLALSGGAASAALLFCMCEMQAPLESQRPSRGKVPFSLTVLHIDYSMHSRAAGQQAAADSSRDQQQQQQLQEQLASLAAATGNTQQPAVLHISDVFCDDEQLQQLLAGSQSQSGAADIQPQPDSCGLGPHPQQQQQQQHMQRLQDLVSAVGDPTGREDLLAHLRDNLLLRAAAALGCNRLLRGDSASRMAVRIVAEAAKGRGYSLPGDIQAMDGRFLAQLGLCVLQPLREVTHKELRQLCTYRALPLLPPEASSGSSGGLRRAAGAGDSSNVNALSERFVREMEAGLPASIYAIIRTAAHLARFEFTDAAALLPQAAEALQQKQKLLRHRNQPQQQQQQQQQQQNTNGHVRPAAAAAQLQLCSICKAPLELQGAVPGSTGATAAGQAAASNHHSISSIGGAGFGAVRQLCYSCNRQILQQVKPPAAAAAASAATTAVAPGVLSLEKLQRLKQLLPPGLLLESDSEDE